jgi:hypothetical protein
LGKLKIREYDAMDNVDKSLWNKLKAYKIVDDSQYPHKFRTWDLEEGVSIKAGKMHIRLGKQEMIDQGAYGFTEVDGVSKLNWINVHYDKFDVVMFPLLHVIFDTYRQGRFGAY